MLPQRSEPKLVAAQQNAAGTSQGSRKRTDDEAVKVVQRTPALVAGDSKEEELNDLFSANIDPLDSAAEFGPNDFKTTGDDQWTAQHALRAQAQSSMRFNKRFKGTKLSLRRPDFANAKANTKHTAAAAQRAVVRAGSN